MTKIDDRYAPKIKSPKSYAGGKDSVKSSLSHVYQEVGAKIGVKSILSINQKNSDTIPDQEATP